MTDRPTDRPAGHEQISRNSRRILSQLPITDVVLFNTLYLLFDIWGRNKNKKQEETRAMWVRPKKRNAFHITHHLHFQIENY